MKIGYTSKTYPDQRCIIDKTDNEYIYVNKKRNWRFQFKYLLFKLKKLCYWDVFSSGKYPAKSCDIYHTFNSIVDGKTPSIITFETQLPRNSYTINREWEVNNKYPRELDKRTLRELKLLSSSNCKKIIAISKSAYDIQHYMLNYFNVSNDIKEKILEKLCIIHPPQKIYANRQDINKKYEKLAEERVLRLVFIGNDFFRKGGKEIIDCLSMIKKNINFELVVVSRISQSSYIKDINDEEKEKYCNILKERSWIKWYNNIPNSQVVNIIQKSHIGLLPTLADTYGFSVLEMQACGVPVITTSIRALTEINNNNCGWVIDVETRKIGKEAYFSTNEEIRELRNLIKNGLNSYIVDILDKVKKGEISFLIEKAEKSLDRIELEHSEDEYRKKIELIYGEVK